MKARNDSAAAMALAAKATEAVWGGVPWGGEQLIDGLVQRQARPTVDITAPKPHASWR